MTGRQRALAWGGVTGAALLAVGLVALVVIADLDTAGQVAGIVGTIAGLAGLGVSVYALWRPAAPAPPGPPAPPAPASPAITASGHRSVAIGGGVSGTVSTGDGPTPAPAHPQSGAAPLALPTVSPAPAAPTRPPATAHASGERSVAIGGNVSGIVSTGDATTAGPATGTTAGPHTTPGPGAHPGDSDR
ncbi:hypothetical protein [Streptomyces buecherae]|uniref:Trimeric autotransporter adhesin YadA-like head domain-containing protein n=1 Tax=Streptomyces buecherae TaxID=2763006 RepID=A0A7H8NEX9_9ACTN|nr:hypothetical protein [Streptomyces buecherae]QKW53004.1 hypothetical protein HUT08_29555 [Streptomyces buecherae]